MTLRHNNTTNALPWVPHHTERLDDWSISCSILYT
jgi:hypothetical protein